MNCPNLDRSRIEEFLDAVEVRLRAALSAGDRPVAQQVAEIQRNASNSKDKALACFKQPEAAFLNTWVAPAIHATLVERRLSKDGARELLLAESYTALKEISSGPAARPVAFPFGKKRKVTEREIYDQWVGKVGKQRFKQPYPDLAVRDPYGIVFEGKYFRSGTLEYAERQLVAAIHEALFYLGVPAIEARDRVWSYRYACLVAFDASPGSALLAAWNNLKDVRKKFWDCSNLKVIVIAERPGAH